MRWCLEPCLVNGHRLTCKLHPEHRGWHTAQERGSSLRIRWARGASVRPDRPSGVQPAMYFADLYGQE